MKRPDLVVLIAVWEFLTSVFAFIGVGAIMVIGLQTRTRWLRQNVDYDLYSPWIHFGLIVGGAFCLIYAAAALAAGIGLLSGRESRACTIFGSRRIELAGFPRWYCRRGVADRLSHPG